ncbi:hypothetical protein PA39016_003090066 [Pseudomonas aeruginosa 39016]|nr:hypothetical protein PA39016_003090066 [Pseudomonas aeruginosa 39016]
MKRGTTLSSVTSSQLKMIRNKTASAPNDGKPGKPAARL